MRQISPLIAARCTGEQLACAENASRLADVGMALRDQASLQALTEDVIKTKRD